jgi:hypothetical protein
VSWLHAVEEALIELDYVPKMATHPMRSQAPGGSRELPVFEPIEHLERLA